MPIAAGLASMVCTVGRSIQISSGSSILTMRQPAGRKLQSAESRVVLPVRVPPVIRIR